MNTSLIELLTSGNIDVIRVIDGNTYTMWNVNKNILTLQIYGDDDGVNDIDVNLDTVSVINNHTIKVSEVRDIDSTFFIQLCRLSTVDHQL